MLEYCLDFGVELSLQPLNLVAAHIVSGTFKYRACSRIFQNKCSFVNWVLQQVLSCDSVGKWKAAEKTTSDQDRGADAQEEHHGLGETSQGHHGAAKVWGVEL